MIILIICLFRPDINYLTKRLYKLAMIDAFVSFISHSPSCYQPCQYLMPSKTMYISSKTDQDSKFSWEFSFFLWQSWYVRGIFKRIKIPLHLLLKIKRKVPVLFCHSSRSKQPAFLKLATTFCKRTWPNILPLTTVEPSKISHVKYIHKYGTLGSSKDKIFWVVK